jgi:hypothetical protein
MKAGAVVAFAIFTVVRPASALPPMSLNDSARLIIPIQDEENKELWQDLRPDVTPPEAAVGNEGQAPRSGAKATNQTDCEKAVGFWDARNNKCSEKK